MRASLLAVLLLATLAAPSASAADFHVTNFECGGNRGSGQTDQAGNLYVPCTTDAGVKRPHIKVYDAAGVKKQTINLTNWASDVAPSPDGASLYVIGSTNKTAQRFVRQATGAYVLDATWKLDEYVQWGVSYKPLGEFLSTDAAGNIYFSSGTWTASASSVVKYTPAGKFVTQFGEWENSWNTGIFYWMNAGVSAAPDGSSVYVTEVGNNRVQRFDRQADGSYAYGFRIGNDPELDEDPRTGWCGEGVRAGRLAAPYDVALDGAGNIYVLNTSCVQVKVFAPDGTWIHTQQFANPNGYVHGMAVDRAGRAYLPEIGKVLRPGAAPVVQPPAINWVNDAFSGWAYATARAPATTVPTWKWSANGWIAATWPNRTRVWAQPFAVGWKWTWYNNAWYATYTRNIAL